MKFRGVFAIGLSALLIIATGCGANQTAASVSSGADSSETSSSLSVSPAVSAPGVSSEAASSSSQADASSQTGQNVSNQIRAALNTKVPLMLPTSIPVEKGYLTATKIAQTTNYKVNLYETNQPAEINSAAASKGTPIATVEGTEYKAAASAKENINGYLQVDLSNLPDPPVDLGHKIKAMEDAGLGHQWLKWNEGRWYIKVDSPTDPAFRNKDYPDGNQLAKNVVAYLDGHMLPAPQKIGVIQIIIWNQNDGTTVQWQDNQTVYKISSEDPMTALKVAVAMESI